MARKYFGKYARIEKGFLKNKIVVGNLLVTADSFAEAQQQLCERISEFENIKYWLITPYWEEIE
jgi:hypothetical protein